MPLIIISYLSAIYAHTYEKLYTILFDIVQFFVQIRTEFIPLQPLFKFIQFYASQLWRN